MVIIEWIILAGTHQIKNRFMQHLSGCHQSINEENGCIFLLGILALFPLLILTIVTLGQGLLNFQTNYFVLYSCLILSVIMFSFLILSWLSCDFVNYIIIPF